MNEDLGMSVLAEWGLGGGGVIASWTEASRDLHAGAQKEQECAWKGTDCCQAGLQKEQVGQGHQYHPPSSRHHTTPLPAACCLTRLDVTGVYSASNGQNPL